MKFSDTIVALATAPQNAALGIIRLSGPEASAILKKVFLKNSGDAFQKFKPRYFHFGKFLDHNNQILDEGLAVYMPSPHSFTGEDVVEIHCHGNFHLLKKILNCLLKLDTDFNIRAAEPGEFSKRAFLNGKIDLTQAEAIHGLISAQSEASLKAHLANLDGALERQISEIRVQLMQSLALVEASFEFPEEDIQTFNKDEVFELLQKTQTHLQKLLEAHQTAKLYDQGVKVAILGKPNVGKSSLLNALLVEDRAIVTPQAGTTRDVIEGQKIIQGLRFVFFDTAGLRETSDQIESVGIQKSKTLAKKADLVLLVTDDPNQKLKFDWPTPTLKILNKADLFSDLSVQQKSDFDLTISVKTDKTLEVVENLLFSQVSQNSVQNEFHINERQHLKIQDSFHFVQNICQNFKNIDDIEILAEDIRHIIRLLDEVTGHITNDDVLGEIFSKFCIGK